MQLIVQGFPGRSSGGAQACLLTGGTLPRDMAENLSVSVPTLYRWLPASART
jgi:hypothetical protein